MRLKEKEKVENAYWYSFNDEPVLTRGVFGLSSPSFLLPEESPDGLWHMFVHTRMGVEQLVSTSGLEWKREHLIVFMGRSPSIFREGSTYYLFYEIHSRTSFFRKNDNSVSSSRIMVTTSTDLMLWSEPRTVLDSMKITRAQYKGGSVRVSQPQVVAWGGGYRLYFGAGEAEIYDTSHKAPARLMYAESDYLDKGYRVNPEPVLDIDGDDMYRNLAVGSVRILPCSDGIAAFECAFSYDRKRRKSTTNILLLVSQDGIHFDFNKVIQETPSEGWASRYITSLDVRYKESENSWYCYYSADGNKKVLGIPYVKESLGLLLGSDKS